MIVMGRKRLRALELRLSALERLNTHPMLEQRGNWVFDVDVPIKDIVMALVGKVGALRYESGTPSRLKLDPHPAEKPIPEGAVK